jgi:hypothetical protein
MLVLQYAYFLLLPLLCSERPFLCRKDQIMDIDKLLVKISNLRKLQDNIAYEITQVVSKANAISEILYSISYEDDAPVDVSEFLLDNEIYTLDNFDCLPDGPLYRCAPAQPPVYPGNSACGLLQEIPERKLQGLVAGIGNIGSHCNGGALWHRTRCGKGRRMV